MVKRAIGFAAYRILCAVVFVFRVRGMTLREIAHQQAI